MESWTYKVPASSNIFEMKTPLLIEMMPLVPMTYTPDAHLKS